MSTEENVQLVKNFFAAMGSSNARDLLALAAEDIEWIIPGEGWPLAGTHRGHAELAAALKKASEEVETQYPKPPEFVAQGDRVMVVGVAAGKIKATNRPFKDKWVFDITVRDGKVAHIQEYIDTQALARASQIDARNDQSLDQIFRSARTPNGWADRPVGDDLVREIYDLLKWGPTSANSSPARFVWVRSPDGKATLAGLAAEPNKPKILKAPVTVIIGHDLDFAGELPKLLPHAAGVMQKYFAAPDVAEVTAMRNGTLQGAYLIVAARALGLDCGPMSGFDNAGVDKAFFSGTRVRSNFICSIGHGDPASVFPRNPRLSFEEAGRWA